MYCLGRSWKCNRRRFQSLPEDTWYLQLLIFPEAINVCFPLVGQYLYLKNHLGCYSYLLHSACFFFVWFQIDRIYLPSADTIWNWQTTGAAALLALLPRVLEGHQVRGWLLHSQKGTNPEQPLQTFLLYKILSFPKYSGWVCVYHPALAGQSQCFLTSTVLLLLEGDADPMYYQCRRAARKRNSCIKWIFTSRTDRYIHMVCSHCLELHCPILASTETRYFCKA